MHTPPRITSLAALALFAAAALTGCASLPGANPAPTSTAQSDTDFSIDELSAICIDMTSSAFAEDVEFDAASTRVEQRDVDPEWLVLVPARTGDHDGEAQCTIGGTPDDPKVEMSAASIEPLPEDQIQRLIIGENEGGTK